MATKDMEIIIRIPSHAKHMNFPFNCLSIQCVFGYSVGVNQRNGSLNSEAPTMEPISRRYQTMLVVHFTS
jgi:hypothetical protein